MGGHSGIKSALFDNSNSAQNLSNQYSSQALGIQSALTPQLEDEAANPQGYNPTTMGQMTTAAEQTAGGSNAGISGSAGLRAARTRNIGSGQATTAAAGQGAGQELSQINAGIQTKNADLKAKQQQAGLSGLEGVGAGDMSAGENALGLSNSALGTAGNMKNFWQEYLLQAQKEAGQMAGAGGG